MSVSQMLTILYFFYNKYNGTWGQLITILLVSYLNKFDRLLKYLTCLVTKPKADTSRRIRLISLQ